jgi:glycosyltransferase involved in cell wall biosynthesis
VKLVRQLPSLGFTPVVVTGPIGEHARWRPQYDTLARELGEVEVHRISTPEPPRSVGRREQLARWSGTLGPWERWLEDGLVEAGLRAGPVDLIYADLGPDPTARAAARLSEQLGVPHIVDLQDPWALDEMRVFRAGWQRSLDRRRMRASLGRADMVIMNTREATSAVREAFPELASTPVETLEYGYDAIDFEGLGPEPLPEDGKFRIVHTGSFHTHLGRHYARSARMRHLLRGGADLPVDVLTRSPLYLMQAVDRLLEEDPSLKDRLEIVVAGLMLDADREILDGSPVVRAVGFLSHGDTLDLMRSADLLFLPMQNLPVGVRARAVPCKTYEYLASGRPLLAAVPDGDGRDLVEAAENAFTVRPDDPDAMARVIKAELARGERRASVSGSRAELLRRLERGHLSSALADIFASTMGTARRAGSSNDTRIPETINR